LKWGSITNTIHRNPSGFHKKSLFFEALYAKKVAKARLQSNQKRTEESRCSKKVP
jgi:hypothetical protein